MVSIRTIYAVVLLTTFTCVLRCEYDDVEKKCQDGEKISAFKRDSTDNENGRLNFECGSMKPSADSVQELKCEQGKPFTCNGQVTGCPVGSWMAGVTSYQLDKSGSPDLLVPTCCTASNVNIEQCTDRRLNSVNSKIDNVLNDDEVYQAFTCLPLVKSGRQQGDNEKHLSDILYKASICRYTVAVPETTTMTTTTAKTPQADVRVSDSNRGNSISLPTRGPRRL